MRSAYQHALRKDSHPVLILTRSPRKEEVKKGKSRKRSSGKRLVPSDK
jgi:hypothetical protein